MIKTSNFKTLALGSLTLTALAASQGAFAHTRLETPTVPEATRVHNEVVISHGCPPTTARRPTFGTTVVFPNAVSYTPVIGVNQNNTGATAGLAGAAYTTNQAATYYSPLAGIGAMINGGGPWMEGNGYDAGNLKVDSAGNKDGFWAGGVAYDQTISTYLAVPFFSAAITIAPASCARSVTFELAIADICDVTVPSTIAADTQVLYWSPIPNFLLGPAPGGPFGAPTANLASTNLPGGIPAGPKYSNYDGYADAAHTIAGDGWGSPATLKVTRNLTTNPLPKGCSGNGGAGDDIFVFPSAQQINAELPAWSNTKQTGINWWK